MHLRNPIPTLSAIITALCAPLPAQQSDVAATFEIRGETRQVSTIELALELARRERHRTRGQDALSHLVDRTLVQRAAKREGVAPTKAEIEARITEVGRTLEAQGVDLARYLAEKNLTREAFEQSYVGLSLAHEKLVMKSAELTDRAHVTRELLELWLEEARNKAGVETDPTKLGSGFVARVDGQHLTLADLGDVLLQNASRKTRENSVRQIAVRAILTDAAKQRGIEVTQSEIEVEIQRRRKLIESDPAYNGVPYEQLLKANGTSLKELRSSPVIRAQVYRRKLVRAELSDAELDRRIAENRSAVLLEHGPRRHLHVILIRASDPPNEFITLDFAAALERANAVRKRMADGMAFATAAKIHSDEPTSKVRGGDIGKLSLLSDKLPRPVLDAAYHLDTHTVSEPIKTEQGYFLTMVSEIEAPPDDETLRHRLRETLGTQFMRDLLVGAKIRLADTQ